MSSMLLQPEGALMCSVSCFTRNGEGYIVHDYSVERWYVDHNTGRIEHRNAGETSPEGNQWEEFYDESGSYSLSAAIQEAAFNAYDPGFPVDYQDFPDEREY